MSDRSDLKNLPRAAPGASLGLVLVLALGLAGCLVGPSYRRPAPPDVGTYLPPEPPAAPANPAAVAGTGATAGAAGGAGLAGVAAPPVTPQRIALGQRIPTEWWQLFHSARLDAVLRDAIAANYTLAAAKATLAAAQEAVTEARAALHPQADLLAGVRRATAGPGVTANLFSLGPSASYSVDAFGGTRRRIEQQAALADSSGYQLAAAYLTLTGGAVTGSITIASVRFQIATVEDLIRNDEKNLNLVQREFEAGKVARSDVLTAAAQLESDRTQLPALRQQLSVARHALTVLASQPTGRWAPPDFDIGEFTLPDDLPLTLPSELVRQRPDILAAEAQLRADSAAIGVATAQMYPSLTLSASFLEEAAALGRFFTAAARSWSAGASADAPLYRGGSLAAQRRAAVDTYNAQLAVYQQTILQAFGQVADALTALQHDAELVAVARRAVDIAGTSLNLQRSSYAAGKTSVLQLIVAENTYSDTRLALVRAIGQRLSDTAQLFIAAGGSWWSDGVLPPT